MKAPTDPPPGLIAVPVPKAVLLLTPAEYRAGIRRGKWWRRRTELERRKPSTPGVTHDTEES